MYGALFRVTDGRELSSPMPNIGTTPSAGLFIATSLDASPDIYRAPPRPLPYDIDPRYVRLQRDGLVSRREKIGMSHLHSGETEPLRRNNSDDGEQMTTMQRRNGVDYDDEIQGYKPNSPGKRQSSISMGRVGSMASMGEDEDVCPTCLDGYSTENPKISTHCGHHFHLGCIYEWMERSKLCPVCDQEMIFSESP